MNCSSNVFNVGKLSKKGKFKICCKECGQKGSGLLNYAINNSPFEMHLPGHNFTGPGTQLLTGKKRLNDDLTWKEWSKPINRVDLSAYKHDICYLKNKDTETRNKVCDKNMLNELDNIKNPTIRERIDRAVVKPIIKAKQTFGMGCPNTMYCLKCKTHTDTKDIYETTSKNNRLMKKGICSVCGSKKSVFLGKI